MGRLGRLKPVCGVDLLFLTKQEQTGQLPGHHNDVFTVLAWDDEANLKG